MTILTGDCRTLMPAHARLDLIIAATDPTVKPSVLLEILIRTSCPEGGLVGDWFAGSGAAGEACRLSGRRYLGCEIDTAMAERARARIATVLPFDGGNAA